MWEIQAGEPVFGSSEVDLTLRESARAAGYTGPEDIINIVCGLAVSVVRTECQLMPELIRPTAWGTTAWPAGHGVSPAGMRFGNAAARPAISGFPLMDWYSLEP